MTTLAKLKGLGPKTEIQLNAIGIMTREDLAQIGAIKAFLTLKEKGHNPSLNFLYAMVGALEDRAWTDIANTEKGKLLYELEDFEELEKIMKAEGIEI